MTEDILNRQEMKNLDEDAATLAKFINDAADAPNPGQSVGTLTSRLGQTYRNLASIIALLSSVASPNNTFIEASAVLTNSSRTYANGQAVAGQVWKTLKRNFSYVVAASSATDHHVTSSGGVKLYVLSGPEGFDVRAFGAVGNGVTNDYSAIAAAISAASSTGGGTVLLPIGHWLINQTLVIPRSISLVGSARTGGQRGTNQVNHTCTIKYTGTGSAIQCGSSGNNGVSIYLHGFAIVAESGDANYRNFTGVEFFDFRNSQIGSLYVEGANIGYNFTGQGGAVVFCATERLNAHGCVIGVQTECPTPSGQTTPFIQALTLGVGEISSCITAGIRLGGGQQNHSRIWSNGGEIGNNQINIHLDADENGTRSTWQADGPLWLENAASGNIVADAGTLYLGGDITNSDNNASGGIRYNGGTVLPLGRSAFDDYSIPFDGFSSNGLTHAWSFVDEGGNDFHCALTRARASIIGTGATKTPANTRFGDGVAGGGSGGLRVFDTSFDWTQDWTIAVLIHTPTVGNGSIFTEVQDNAGPSFLELAARPGFVRIRTRHAGGTVQEDDLTGTQDNPVRGPFWVVVSYDASATELQYRAPNGEVVGKVTREVSSTLSANAYDAWHLKNLSTGTDNIIDELLVYSRVLTAGEVRGIFELRSNVTAALGVDPRPVVDNTATATDLADNSATVNTTGKVAGLRVWDTTNRREMRARGGSASDPWDVIDGSISVTPS